MATKTAIPSEKLFECEVKRRRVRASGNGYEPFWKVKSVQDAILDGDTEFRCKECHGALKLTKRHIVDGPPSHVQHKLRGDSEYCTHGAHFLNASDGREPRVSGSPVL